MQPFNPLLPPCLESSLPLNILAVNSRPHSQFHWGEIMAALSGWFLGFLNLALTVNVVEPFTMLLVYLVVTGVCVPMQIVALYYQVGCRLDTSRPMLDPWPSPCGVPAHLLASSF